MSMVRLDVLSVARLEGPGEHLLVLKERGGDRLLPITIGRFEAGAIQRALNGVRVSRPAAHDLLASVIGRLGGRVEQVVIHDIHDDTFFSQLDLHSERGLLEVDCRTSDAVALALRLKCPIVAVEEVMTRAGVLPRPKVVRQNDGEGPTGRAT